MKKFTPNENFAYTPPVTQQNVTTNNFDLSQLLQILQKLNLNGLFGINKNNDTQQSQTPNYPQIRQDLMRAENLRQATISIQNHRNFVNKINENNNT